MMDNTALKTIGSTMADFAITSGRKVMELNTELFNSWVAMNKKILDLTPAKDMFTQFTAPKK